MSKWLDGSITLTEQSAKKYSKEMKSMAKAINKLLKDVKELRKAIPVTDL
ncbi:MAG: hypothetical protein NMK33_04495 [Candidatus Cardinium sp.]|nr:hypothetical protein [Cardinium endosymbiont of Dermatophagoides farinae]UWW96686.1 MAG: hypothetical protein NMK33_04495 [Candidatus Cardinium sp.]